MVLGGHRQVVLVRPADSALVVHVLHYPEQVRYCPLAAPPVGDGASEELRLAGLRGGGGPPGCLLSRWADHGSSLPRQANPAVGR
jgi:hypothetical protein